SWSPKRATVAGTSSRLLVITFLTEPDVRSPLRRTSAISLRKFCTAYSVRPCMRMPSTLARLSPSILRLAPVAGVTALRAPELASEDVPREQIPGVEGRARAAGDALCGGGTRQHDLELLVVGLSWRPCGQHCCCRDGRGRECPNNESSHSWLLLQTWRWQRG